MCKDMTIEQKKIIMKSNVPLNLVNQLEKKEKEEEEPEEVEEVKQSTLDLMKTSISELNKRFVNYL